MAQNLDEVDLSSKKEVQKYYTEFLKKNGRYNILKNEIEIKRGYDPGGFGLGYENQLRNDLTMKESAGIKMTKKEKEMNKLFLKGAKLEQVYLESIPKKKRTQQQKEYLKSHRESLKNYQVHGSRDLQELEIKSRKGLPLKKYEVFAMGLYKRALETGDKDLFNLAHKHLYENIKIEWSKAYGGFMKDCSLSNDQKTAECNNGNTYYLKEGSMNFRDRDGNKDVDPSTWIDPDNNKSNVEINEER
jgi:hypothetical protein